MTHKNEIEALQRGTGAADLLVHLACDPALDPVTKRAIQDSYGRYIHQSYNRRLPTNPATYAAKGEAL